MDNKPTIQDLKNGFNHSIFSTEVSSRSHIDPNPSQTNQLVHISSRFMDEPYVYLKKLKKRTVENSGLCLQALKGTIKARASLQKVQHKTLMCRYEFLKLHQIKTFKKKERSFREEHKVNHEEVFRQSMGKIKRRKELNELCLSLRKEGQVRNIEALQQAKRQKERMFRETMSTIEEKGRKKLQQITERVKREKAQSYLRKKNLNDLTITRSKFNYLSKINEQMQIIEDYQDQLQHFKLQYLENEAKQTKETTLPILSATISGIKN